MPKCVNHPIKEAVAHCKRCNDTLCLDCRIKSPEGIFCSNDCVMEFREFQGRVYAGLPRNRSRFSLIGAIKSLVIAAILVAVIWVIMTSWLGDDIGEWPDKLKQMIKLIY